MFVLFSFDLTSLSILCVGYVKTGHYSVTEITENNCYVKPCFVFFLVITPAHNAIHLLFELLFPMFAGIPG